MIINLYALIDIMFVLSACRLILPSSCLQPKVVSILKSANAAGLHEREFVGRANSYLLIIKKVVAEVIHLPRTINSPPESDDRRACARVVLFVVVVVVVKSCHGFSAIHTVYRFDGYRDKR